MTDPTSQPDQTNALDVVDEALTWYHAAARRARRRYQGCEVAILVAGALAPASAVVTTDRRAPALLGTVVVVLMGLRSVFRWHENWQRFTQAGIEIKAARWLFQHQVPPYDGENRAAMLVQTIADTQTEETGAWIRLRRSVDVGQSALTQPAAEVR